MYVLPVPRHDDADATARDVLEANVEPTELAADDEEHAERLPRVLDLGQEVRREPERQRDLRRLVEVRLQDAPGKTSAAGTARGRAGRRTC